MSGIECCLQRVTHDKNSSCHFLTQPQSILVPYLPKLGQKSPYPTVRLELGPHIPLITPFSALKCALRAPSTAPSPPPCPRHMSPRTAARGFPGPPPPRPLGSTRPAGSASQLCVCGEPPHRRARSAFAAHRMVLPDLCGAYHRPPNPQHPHGKHYANSVSYTHLRAHET